MQHITFSVENGVARITLNRPEVLNSFNMPMGAEVSEALDRCAADSDVRAVYLTGEGRGFCAGQELQEAIAPDGPGIAAIVENTYNPMISKIRSIEKPVICGVNGVAAGAGANLALACDVTFAVPQAKFVQAFSSIGLVPDSGGTHVLPRLIGKQRAAALMFTADKVTAQEAMDMGMIYKVVDEANGLQEAIDFAERLAQRPTRGIGLTKRLLNKGETTTLAQQLNLEKEAQIEAFSTEDCKEGVNAFLEKRAPKYTGR